MNPFYKNLALWLVISLMMIMLFQIFKQPERSRIAIDYSEFLSMVENESVIQVTIQGTGFAAEGNIVTFGGIPTEGIASAEGGTRITFWVPKEVPSAGEAPPMVLDPGEYDVTVTTPTGTTEPVVFILTRGA